MVFAYAAMDLQELSGGRFRLGLGTQVKGHIQRRFSTEWSAPGPRMREYVQSLHAIWDSWQESKRLAFHGDHYNFSLMTPFFSPGPSQQPRPPVFISAVNTYNCRVAGEVCDGVSLHPLCSPKYLKQRILPSIADGAARAGRDPKQVNLSGSSFIITGPSQAVIDARRRRSSARSPSIPPRARTPPCWKCTGSKKWRCGSTKCRLRASGTRWPA